LYLTARSYLTKFCKDFPWEADQIFETVLDGANNSSGIDTTDSGYVALRILSFGDAKINAIKLIRALSKRGLKEAKDFSEQDLPGLVTTVDGRIAVATRDEMREIILNNLNCKNGHTVLYIVESVTNGAISDCFKWYQGQP
jgi:hypothetical protein